MAQIKDLKQSNIHHVRLCFFDQPCLTKNEIARQTQLSLALITNILHYLLKENEIIYIGDAHSTGGRKSKQYKLNYDYHHIGLLILKKGDPDDKILIKSAPLNGTIVFNKTLFVHHLSEDDVLMSIKTLLHHDPLIKSICISLPGVCQNGTINICDFEKLVDTPLVPIIEAQFNITCTIENDVNLATIGFSKTYPCHYLAFMYQPKIKYIGCGLMIHNHICHGFSQFAGELSYLPHYSFKKQEQMIETTQGAIDLLTHQIVSLCSVMNPEIIGIHSELFHDLNQIDLDSYIPKTHQPSLILVDHLDEWIDQGAIQLALNDLKNTQYGGKTNE